MIVAGKNRCTVRKNDFSGKNSVLPRIIADHLGSIRVVLDQNGNVDSWTDYYPFGKEARGSSSVSEPKEQFTGKERDAESGLDYFGARYYNAEIGRWVSVDPLSAKYSSVSPYVYTLNNPIIYLDEDGRDVVTMGKLLKSVVNEAYRKSATFRAIYNAQRANRDVVQILRLQGGPSAKNYRGQTTFTSFSVDGVTKKQIQSKIGSFESGKAEITGHELAHGKEIGDNKEIKTDQEYKATELEKGGHVTSEGHLETEFAKDIEAKIIKELQDASDDVDLGDVDVTEQTYLDETHKPEEERDKKEDEEKQD